MVMNKKYYGKISRQLPAIVANEDGIRLKVTTIDTATDGLSILCNIHQRDQITPGGSFLRNGRPAQLSIVLDLPDGSGQASPFMATCHVAYSRRISKEKCMIGMRYIDLERDSEDVLRRFIKNASMPNVQDRSVA